MILVDTSIWIAHFRAADVQLIALLTRNEVLAHPFVIGKSRSAASPGGRTCCVI